MLGILAAGIAAITSTAISVVQTIGAIGLAVEGLKLIGNIIMGIGKALGIIKPDIDVEQLGDKALQAEESGIVPENFSSYEAYVNTVQDFKTDPEKSNRYSPDDKIKKGTEVSAALAIEKCPNVDMEKLLKLPGNDNFMGNIERFSEICKMAVTNPLGVNAMTNYIYGTSANKTELDLGMDLLKDIEKNLVPEISDDDALRNVLMYQN